MKRIALKVLIASLLIPCSYSAASDNASFVASSLRIMKSAICLGVASAVGIAAYKLNNSWKVNKSVAAARKARRAIENPIKLQPVEIVKKGQKATTKKENTVQLTEEDVTLLAQREQCVFPKSKFDQVFPTARALYDNGAHVIDMIRTWITQERLPLCNEKGVRYESLKNPTMDQVLTTMSADQKTYYKLLHDLGVQDKLDGIYSRACQLAGFNTQALRNEPWTRTIDQQEEFDYAFEHAMVEYRDARNGIVDRLKLKLFGNSEQELLEESYAIYRELDYLKTLKHIVQERIQHENKLAQERLEALRRNRDEQESYKTLRQLGQKEGFQVPGYALEDGQKRAAARATAARDAQQPQTARTPAASAASAPKATAPKPAPKPAVRPAQRPAQQHITPGGPIRTAKDIQMDADLALALSLQNQP